MQQQASLCEKLAKKISPIIAELHPELEDKVLMHRTRDFFDYENYLIACFLAASEIDVLVQQLNQAVIFLGNFRTNVTLKKNNISRFDFIIYHIENHLFRVTGILDRILILVNRVLKLNINDKQCDSKNLLYNPQGKKGKYAEKIEKANNQLFQALVALLNYVDIFREDRNSITHRTRYSNDRLRDVEMLHVVKLEEMKYLEKKLTDEKVKEYKSELLECNKKIIELLSEIYQHLEFEFNKNYTALKN